MRILFTGGGTGGHIFPLIAVARELKKISSGRTQGLEMFYLGPKDDFAQKSLTQEGIRCDTVAAGKLRRYFDVQNFVDVVYVAIGVLQCLWKVWRIMPDAIFSKGGYGSLPVVLVGRLYFIPIIIHESDSVPGLANRIGGKLAKKIAVSFPRALKYFPAKKTALVGNPVRRELFGYDRIQAKKDLGLSASIPAVLFLGGSQGAQKINETVLRLLGKLTEKTEIVHQCGNRNFEEFRSDVELVWNRSWEKFPRYHLFAFLDEQNYGKALMAADLVAARASAGTIFEIATAQKPSILIPLPNSAGDHQKINAYDYAKTGAAEVMEENNLTPNLFFNQIESLLDDAPRLQEMAERAKGFANPDAAMIIAKEIMEWESD